MTTPAAAQFYMEQHQRRERGYIVFNPKDRPVEDLPVIYGFANGGSAMGVHACAIASDGWVAAQHCCSHPNYMPHDLALVESGWPSKIKEAEEHFPDGYRTELVDAEAVKAKSNAGFEAAVKLAEERAEAEAAQEAEARSHQEQEAKPDA